MENTSQTSSLPNFFERLKDIHRFSLNVDLPRLPMFSDHGFRALITETAYDVCLKAIQTASFYSEENLDVSSNDETITVQYKDDEYNFRLTCSPSHLKIARDGSSMETFKKWYENFMPHTPNIVKDLLSSLSQSKTARIIEPLRLQYSFGFIMYDFRDEESDTPRKNFEIINKLLSKTPGDDGRIITTPSYDPALVRMDYNVHKWVKKDNDNYRNLIFRIEAPANNRSTSLWASFVYKGETYTDPDTGNRTPMRSDFVLNEFGEAFDFLQNIAANGFLDSVLGNYIFKTTTGDIP